MARMEDVDGPVRVVIALGESARSDEFTRALLRRGIDVGFAEGLAEVGPVDDADESFVVLVDDADDGWLGAVSDLVRRCPAVKPLAMAEAEGHDRLLAALSAGVVGFLPRDASADAVVRSVRSIVEYGVAIPESMVPALVSALREGHSVQTAEGSVPLSRREWQILQTGAAAPVDA